MSKVKLPQELKHLQSYADNYEVKELKPGVWGFFIPQFSGKSEFVENKDWLKFRRETIGASEVAMTMGLDDYRTLARLFWEKIGQRYDQIPSEAAHWGHVHEENIAHHWSYFTGDDKDYLVNMAQKGFKPRKYSRLSCYVINVQWPFLSMSMDFRVHKNQMSYFKGEKISYDYPLEVKTISNWVSQKFVNNVPINYVPQVTQQMLIWDCEYMEFAALRDGNKMEILPFEFSFDFGSQLLDSVTDFWENRVIPGREAFAKKEEIEMKAEEAADLDEAEGILLSKEPYEAKIQELEPPPDTTKAYEAFYKEHCKSSAIELTRSGTDEEFELCMAYKDIGKEIKELESQKQLKKNEILKMIGKSETVDFGKDYGKAIWRRDRQDTQDYFGVNTKRVEVNEDFN